MVTLVTTVSGLCQIRLYWFYPKPAVMGEVAMHRVLTLSQSPEDYKTLMAKLGPILHHPLWKTPELLVGAGSQGFAAAHVGAAAMALVWVGPVWW